MIRFVKCIFLIVASAPCFAQSVSDKADNLLLNSRYEEAIQLIDSILVLQPLQESLLLKKAEGLIRLGEFDKASATLDHIRDDHADRFLQATKKSLYGFIQLNQGYNDLALESLQTSLHLYHEINRTASLEYAQALSYLGTVYFNTRKYEQAQEQLHMALSIREKLVAANHELMAASYNDLGLLYSQTDNDRALDYYEKALSIYTALYGSTNTKIAIINTNIGSIYRTMELYGDALISFETALKLWSVIYPKAHPSKAFVLYTLGITYKRMNNRTAARGYFEKALGMYEEVYGPKHPQRAEILNELGILALDDRDYATALTHFQQAFIANIAAFETTDTRINPETTDAYNKNILLYSLSLKAKALEQKYFGKSLKVRDLQSAIHCLNLSNSLIDELRRQSKHEHDKLAFGELANEVYADGVRIAYTLSDVSFFNRKLYREQSFHFAEKSKSAILLDAISDVDAKSFAKIPPPLLEEERLITTQLANYSQLLANKPSEEDEKKIREKIFDLSQRYQQYVTKLEKNFPEYFNLKYNVALPSISDLQSKLNSETAIVSYFVDEVERKLYTYVITSKRYTVYEGVLEQDFEKNITGFRNSLYYRDYRTFIKTSGELAATLLPKFSTSIKNIVFIPSGRLSAIPFEALVKKPSADPIYDYRNLRYLIHDYSIRYEFSAGLAIQKSNKGGQNNQPRVMLCAPVSFNEEMNLVDLPGTATEVNTIANLFTSHNIPAQLYLNASASEQNVKSDVMQQYSLIHLATHGIVDETHPELSRIYLQASGDDEDGYLYASEIYNLQLNADLVTLSACQTGLGKISKGEGVIGLSRALVYAGARNLVVSYWSVADESTAMMMTAFYNQYVSQEGSSKTTSALRQAKLSLIRSENYSAPYYWAPFVLIGF